MSDAPVQIAGPQLAARIDPFGAELLSLTDADGREYMTDADPAFWTGHAPLLFPIVGGLVGDRYRHGGTEYALPRHGFARRSHFEVIAGDGDSVTFRLSDSAETRAAYPFAFTLDMAFAVDGPTLRMTARVTNPGAEVLPFSFGYHPAFAWPLPGGGDKLGHALIFAADEPQDVRRLDAAGLLDGSEPSPVKDRVLPLSPGLFAADALVWDHVHSRRIAYRSPGGPWLEIAFDLPMLGIWQKPGAEFICIEPWAGHADPAGFTGEVADKPGIVLLPPGSEMTLGMDVTVRPR